jgi:hypothetical protein
MIDNIEQVDRLIPKLRASLPLAAGLTPRLAEFFRERLPGRAVPAEFRVVAIEYAGYGGGIMCRLVVTNDEGKDDVFYVSITHLTFQRRHPLAREIAAYQKHRMKRMRILDADRPSKGSPQIVAHTYS